VDKQITSLVAVFGFLNLTLFTAIYCTVLTWVDTNKLTVRNHLHFTM